MREAFHIYICAMTGSTVAIKYRFFINPAPCYVVVIHNLKNRRATHIRTLECFYLGADKREARQMDNVAKCTEIYRII